MTEYHTEKFNTKDNAFPFSPQLLTLGISTLKGDPRLANNVQDELEHFILRRNISNQLRLVEHQFPAELLC